MRRKKKRNEGSEFVQEIGGSESIGRKELIEGRCDLVTPK